MATRVDELRNGNAGPSGAYVDLDDRMLVLDFQAGNGNRDPAFAEIHRRYSGLARHVSYRILANASDAEDATQETMLRVLQGLGRFNGRYRLQPWVARIATNVSLDILRARARRPQSADGELAELEGAFDDADEPSVLVEQLLERERIQKVLAELPDHHREALILREYEGRSHEEIGRALGVTPAQAKALIHRAKGSFRRAWDRKEERSWGLPALAPLFLAPFRASEWFRRLFGSATDAAAATSASPAAATTAISVGERVTAAAVVVVMAATVGVGAVTLRHRADGKADQQQAVVVAPSPAAPVVAPVVRPDRTEPKRAHKPGHARGAKADDPTPVVEVAPAVSPTPPPSPSPTVTETPPPSVSPVPPPPPPPPPWNGAFSSSLLGKNIALTQIDSRVEGTVGRDFLFSQATSGSYTDGGGNAQALYIEYWGSAADTAGTASAWIFVDTGDGRYRYDGSLSLTATTLGDDGTWTYVFTGTFNLADAPESDLVMPNGGTASLVLHFWSDKTSLYEASLSLVDAS
jgi:RNA polymerase sigma factor (sigma-70 family)